MNKIKISPQQIKKYAGQWIAIDPKNSKIIASSKEFNGIAPLVIQEADDQKAVEQAPYFFLVPRKDEGPYVL